MSTGEIETRPTLGRLTSEGLAIQKLLLDPEIEDKETLETALSQVEGAWLTKVEAIGNLILDWNDRIDAIHKEEDRLNGLRKALFYRIEWLKAYTMENMIASGEEELQFPLVKVAVATNPPSVDVVEEKEVPSAFLRIIERIEINKRAILEHFMKTGKEITGTRIITDKKMLVVK